MTAAEHFQAGRLDDAIDAANEAVRDKPTDLAARSFLCELLCFAGNLERADKLLDVLGTQDPDAMAGVAEFRQLIRAETERREVFDQGRSPHFVKDPNPSQRLQLEALVAIREGNPAEAVAKLEAAEEARAAVAGKAGETPFDDIRDLDDVVAGNLEVLTAKGEYYWVAFADVVSLQFTKPDHARDLVWRRAEISVAGGLDGVVHVPVLYVGSHVSDDDQLRLGRGTDWRGDDGEPIRGIGQRELLVGEESHPILSLESLAIGT